jgi:GTPase SAR1 family protein
MSGVGKSNLMGRFIHDRFSETEAATVGVDFSSKLLEAADGTKVRAQVWDTGE